MTLPKLNVPTYTLTVPSTKKKVKFRPFLSKEEKILMLVKQSEDPDEILQAMKDIINVCMFEKVDVSDLALFDIEYAFLQIRAKSVGEIIELDMKCKNLVPRHGVDQADMVECGNLIPFKIDLSKVEVEFPEDHTNTIMLEKEIGITMRYPSVNDLEMLEENKEDDVEIIKSLILNIFDKDNVYEVSETSDEDYQEFIDTLGSNQIQEIRNKFFFTMPFLSEKVEYKCSKCGIEESYTFSGINDFF